MTLQIYFLLQISKCFINFQLNLHQKDLQSTSKTSVGHIFQTHHFHSGTSALKILNYFSLDTTKSNCLGLHNISSAQLLSRVRLFATPWTVARQGILSITNSRSPPKPMSIELVMPSNHLIFCRPLLLLPSIFPRIRVFSNESALRIRWPKDWSFSFHISPSSEHPGMVSFMMDWLDLCAVQGTLKSLLQHHSSKASIYFQPYFSSVPLNSTTLVPKMWMQFSLIQVISIWNVWFYFFFSYPSTTTINEYFMSNMSS